MNTKAVSWLYRELPGLIATGIVSQETADKLHSHYGEVKSVSKTTTIIVILGTIGALLIGLGIILLLAHNWELLSRSVRAVLSLVPLLIGQGLSLWVLLKRPGSSALKEGSATFLSLMVGASIALISQTYNIPGETGTFILTWMLLIIPIVYIMQASIPAAIYLFGIVSWAGSYWNDPARVMLFWPLAALALPHFLWAVRKETYTLRATILSLVMLVCCSVAAGFSLGQTWSGSWFIIHSSMFSIYYSLGWLKIDRMTTLWQRPMRVVGSLGLIIIAFILTFNAVWSHLDNIHSYGFERNIYDPRAIPDHIVTLILIVLAILLCYDNIKRRNLSVAMLAAVPVLSVLAYVINDHAPVVPMLIFNAYLLVLSIHRIGSGLRANNLGSINAGMLILAILIIARFFDSDISFIVKGTVFIIIGIGFLTTNLMLARRMGGAK